MTEYIAEYAFELIEPLDGNHGGYAQLSLTSDTPIETEEHWREVSRLCFQQGNGNYRRVAVTRIGEVVDEPSSTTLDDGDVIG